MNVRRVLILSITALAAGVAGYSLLGLRAPKQASPALSAPSHAAASGTIIAVGPDGTLYAIQAPNPGTGSNAYYGTRSRRGYEEYGESEYGFEH
jgi:hypothetical protein